MSRRRRAAVLLGLALTLGGLAASDVAQREAALDRRLGPLVPVLVARVAVPEGGSLGPARLARRRVPARFAPPAAYRSPAQLAGLRARAALPPGAYLTPAAVRDPSAGPVGLAATLRPGETLADVTGAGDLRYMVPDTRVDVLVTRDAGDTGAARTVVALRGAQVLEARRATAGETSDQATGPQLTVTLRTTTAQAMRLASEEAGGTIRLLARGS